MGCIWTNLVRSECFEPFQSVGNLHVAGWLAGELANTFTFVDSDFIKISVGDQHSLALKANGDLYSTGGNAFGELGLGDLSNRNTFTFVGGGYSAISAGANRSFALKTNGDLYVAGIGSSLTGLGDNDDRDTFTFVDSNVLEVATGSSMSLLIK